MKNNNYNKAIVNTITNSTYFKTIFLFIIIVAAYGAFALVPEYKNIYDAILISHSHIYYNILVFSLIISTTIYTCHIFEQNQNYILRLSTKENYLKNLIDVIVKVNLIIIICLFLTYLMLSNINNLGFYQPKPIYNYNINTQIYSIFYILRYYINLILIAIINGVIYFKILNKVIILDIVFIIMYLLNTINMESITSLSILPFNFFILKNYGTFTNEILNTIVILLIIEILIYLLYKVYLLPKNKIFKYILLNDFSYLIRKHKKILILLFGVPIIIFTIKYLENYSKIQLYSNSLGLNIDAKNFNLIDYLIYYFNVITYIYIIISLYIKDYKNKIEQICLRVHIKEFNISKTISSILILLLVTCIQHLIVIFLTIILNKLTIDKSVISLVFTNYIYIVLITAVSTLLYILFITTNKLKLIVILLALIVFIILPKNIINLSTYKIPMLIINILVLMMINYLSTKKIKKIIQNLGGV